MSRRCGLILILLCASRLLGAGRIQIVLTSPSSDTPVFGEVVVSAEVTADEPVARVEFLLNGRPLGFDEAAPYRIVVDVGDENDPRVFSAVARTTSGLEAMATVVTPAVQIDMGVELWLRQLYVTVTIEGDPVLDLERNDFTILDGGVEQELVTFERGDVPMTIAVLIDASESMRGRRLEAALQAARTFLSLLAPLDEAMVMVFSDRLLRITPFSFEPEQLVAGLEGIEAHGGTALNDHLYAALRLLDQRQGKPVVILLSDGADTLGYLDIEKVLWKVGRSNALIYRIHVPAEGTGRPAFASVWRDFAANELQLDGLEEAIEGSGGRVRFVADIRELGAALGEVLDELRQQYVLGYYPSDQHHDGAWRALEVIVSRPDVVARTRSGYIDR